MHAARADMRSMTREARQATTYPLIKDELRRRVLSSRISLDMFPPLSTVVARQGSRKQKLKRTRMWANAQRDGRPAGWRRLFNAAVWLPPTITVPCSNAANTQNPLKLAGVPQTRQQISAVIRPKFAIL